MQEVKMSKISNDKLGKLYIAKWRITCYAPDVLRCIIQKRFWKTKESRRKR